MIPIAQLTSSLIFSQQYDLRGMGTFTREVTHLHICCPSQEGLTLKGKNLLHEEQILSFKSNPQFGSARTTREANRKSQKFFPLVNMTEKHGSVHVHLKKVHDYTTTYLKIFSKVDKFVTSWLLPCLKEPF